MTKKQRRSSYSLTDDDSDADADISMSDEGTDPAEDVISGGDAPAPAAAARGSSRRAGANKRSYAELSDNDQQQSDDGESESCCSTSFRPQNGGHIFQTSQSCGRILPSLDHTR